MSDYFNSLEHFVRAQKDLAVTHMYDQAYVSKCIVICNNVIKDIYLK